MRHAAAASAARVAVALALVAAVGCAKTPRECGDVVSAISGADGRVQALEEAAGDDPGKQATALRAAATEERTLSTSLESTSIATPSLAEKAKAYAGVARSLAADADAIAASLDRVEPLRRIVDSPEGGGLEPQAASIFQRLGARCAALPAGSCDGVVAARAKLEAVTATDDYAAQADTVASVAGELAKANVPALGALPGDAVDVLLQWAGVLRDLAAVSREIEDGERAMEQDAAAAKPITAAINALCAPSS